MEVSKKLIKVGSDFSGVGAFNQALNRLSLNYKEVYACDMDKYARQTYTYNYGTPEYYPENVYDREIPKESLDIFMTSPPCQSFSLAGKRQGENSDKGILFYNSHEFIQKNKPRYFIFENVKGLLSDDGGKTFAKWCDYLGGKSVNGNPVIFPHDEAVPYHIYHQVLNAKHYGVPQNRERIFIIGIRDDKDNTFSFPKPFHLVKRLKDVLEKEVDEKYFLSDKMLNHLLKHPRSQEFIDEETTNVNCITSNYAKQSSDLQYLKISANTSKGYDIATENDSINFSNPNSETRRGRVGKGVAQTLDTSCNQGVLVNNTNPIVEYQLTGGKWDKTHEQSGRVYDKSGVSPTIHTMQGGNQQPKIIAPEVFQLNPSKESNGCQPYQQNRVYDVRGVMTTLDTDSGKKSILVSDEKWIQGGLQKNQPKQTNGISPCLTSAMGMGGGQTPVHNYSQRIRRLTPTECFRLMDFNKDFKWDVSDSQAYKQAGNSIVVAVLAKIIEKLNL